ncbi:MAG: class I poly(R)-hydroxyalkanoic acid synthase [Proteobacteria bacterium]|nr:class I poly(R)-hydroxyalkanoic acid synthase [Pseudomonadota bacterium]
MTDSSSYLLATPPKAPDPVAAARVFGELTANAQDAALAGVRRLGRAGDPLPFDPAPISEAFSTFAVNLASRPAQLAEAQAKAWREWTELWTSAARRALGQKAEPVIAPARGDRRFSSPLWSEEPVFDTLKQAYLLGSRQLQELVTGAEVGMPARQRATVDFFTRQFLNAASPSNYPLTNPDALKKALDTGGLNLAQGLSNLLSDMAKGQGLVERRSNHDFELGVNIAATPGAVVFQNELMQLIQYAPSTETVYRRPLLFVPPTVNKFYLFDLTPKSSYLKWLVDQGHTVFVLSWANPDETLRHKSLADYVEDGPIAAMHAIEQATGEREIDLVAYCLGGTLSALALAYLQATGEGDRVASATLIATLIDFEEMGDWSIFLDEKQLAAFRRYLDHRGYVEAHDLAKLFSLVRSNDLIWNNVVAHYLMGEEAAPSDLLWWFADASRMPAAMLHDYGRLVLQENRVREPGGIVIDGVPLDMGAVTTPLTVVSLKDDHVSGWEQTFKGAKLFGGETRFILGGSGHNAGMINPPSAKKHGYWTNPAPTLPDTAGEWLAGATKQEGSWWPHWQSWLDQRAADDRVPAAGREPGAGALPALEPAPGSYVRVRH